MKTAAEIIKQAEAQWDQLEKLKQWAKRVGVHPPTQKEDAE